MRRQTEGAKREVIGAAWHTLSRETSQLCFQFISLSCFSLPLLLLFLLHRFREEERGEEKAIEKCKAFKSEINFDTAHKRHDQWMKQSERRNKRMEEEKKKTDWKHEP